MRGLKWFVIGTTILDYFLIAVVVAYLVGDGCARQAHKCQCRPAPTVLK